MKYSLLLIYLLTSFCVLGQSIPRLTNMADRLYDNHRYLEAIEFYDKISGIDKRNYRARYRLGNCYLESLKYQEAENTFYELGTILDSANEYRAQALYKYSSILKTDYKFEEADSILGFVISISNDQELIKLSRKQKEGCLLAMRQSKVDKGFSIELMENVNSKLHDFGAIVNPSNGQLVLATTRNLGGVQYQGSQFEGVLPDLTSYEFARNRWRINGNAQRFDRLNTEWSEGSGSFTKDGTVFYFSSCRGESGSGCSIMVSYLVDDRWSDPVVLNEYINEEGSENKQPSISVTGDTLFFSSDRTGGYGGSDIWMSLRGLEPESWGPAINMGDVINSAEDDISPYYSSAFGCLIFSSNGHVGYGGFDIYAAKGESFFEPELFNLSSPFNSPLDDTYFNISDSLGFLSSNREDRRILNLYSFPVSGERLFLSLLISGESLIDGQVISRFRDTRSLDLFAFRVEDYQGYELFEPEKRKKPRPSILGAENEEPESDTEDSAVAQQTSDYLRNRSSSRAALSTDFEHIYFEYASAKIQESARTTLKDLVAQLEAISYANIEILAYTDISGTDTFNQELSKERGESVKKYLVGLGVAEEKVIVRPRGEGPLSGRDSWYSKMFSRRAEIVVNSDIPFSLSKSRPYAVRYENTVEKTASLLGVDKELLTQKNTFRSDTVEAGSILRLDERWGIIPNIKYFLEEDDLRNSFFIYTVKPKETLASIANKYGTIEELIREINNLDRELKEGEKIFIYQIQ